MWKKFCLFAFAVILMFSCQTFAATKEDVISAINKTYSVGEETFRLPQRIISKAEAYLNSHPLSSEQYSTLLGCIDKAVELAQKNGTTDISKIDKKDIKEGLGILVAASKTANVDLNKELAENNIAIPNLNEENTSETKPKPTSIPKAEPKPNNDEKVNEEVIEQPLDEETNNEDNVDSSVEVTNVEEQVNPESRESAVNTVNAEKDIREIVNKNITFVIVGIILFLFINFLIFYLIFKSKWYRIVKYIVMIILVLLILVALVALTAILLNIEEIRTLYELYYILK